MIRLKKIINKKVWYIISALVLSFTNTIPVQAVSDFYSENDIQFYDPSACDPNESSSSPDNNPRNPGGIYIVGDSITAIAKDSYIKKFNDNGWSPTIEGLSSRHISSNNPSPSGISQVKNDKDKIKTAKTVVVALATNDQGLGEDTLKGQVEDMISEVKKANSDASIFWVNVIDTRSYSRSKNINNIIADSIGDSNIIDWYSKAKSKANLSSFDTGVHPTQQSDIDLLVNTVYDAVSNTDSEIAPDAESTINGESDASSDMLDGHRLPAVKGGTGQEDPVGSDGILTSGDVGSKITFPKHVGHGQEYQDYYLTMRLPYVKWSWNGKASEVKNDELNWYKDKPRKVVVTNPRTNKSIITVLAETGPAPWTGARGSQGSNGYSTPQRYTPENYTGRVSGLPPKAIKTIGAKMVIDGKGDTLYYAWAPDQNAKPGPTSLRATGQGAVGGEDDNPTQTQASCCPSLSIQQAGVVSGRDNEQKVWNYFKNKGLDDNAVAGIMGNISQESGFDPENIQDPAGRTKDPSGISSGWGLVQWTPGSKVLDAAKRAGVTTPIHELQSQLDVIWYQANSFAPPSGKGIIEEFKRNSTSPKESASAWERLMEAAGDPRMERRWAAAAVIYNKYKGTGGTSTTNNIPSGDLVNCSCNDPTIQPSAASGLDGAIKDATRTAGSHEEGATAVSVASIDGQISSDVGGDDQKQTRSVYKIYVAYGVMYSIEKGNLSWDTRVSGSYLGQAASGTVSDVMEKMIVNSNNGAAKALATKNSDTGGVGLTNLLQNKVGLSNKTVMGDYSGSGGTNTKSTTNDIVKFLQLLHSKKLPGVANDAYYNKLISYMKRATTDGDSARSGIVSGVGGVEVADKPGWNGASTNNDAGIVYLKNKPYAIAIISGGGWQNVSNIAKAAHSAISGMSGASGSCEGAITGDLSATVRAYAWPDYHSAPYLKRKPAYASAVEKAKDEGKYIGGTVGGVAGIDCGGFVTRVLQDSGFDTDYNNTSAGKGNTWGGQIPYLKNSGKWKKVTIKSTSDLEPGDVAINHTHTFLYVGQVTGFNEIFASASYSTSGNGRSPMAGQGDAMQPGKYEWYRKK
jgi:beta-lactamase class A